MQWPLSQCTGQSHKVMGTLICRCYGRPVRLEALVRVLGGRGSGRGSGLRADRLGFHAHLCYFFGWETKGKLFLLLSLSFPNLGSVQFYLLASWCRSQELMAQVSFKGPSQR